MPGAGINPRGCMARLDDGMGYVGRFTAEAAALRQPRLFVAGLRTDGKTAVQHQQIHAGGDDALIVFVAYGDALLPGRKRRYQSGTTTDKTDSRVAGTLHIGFLCLARSAHIRVKDGNFHFRITALQPEGLFCSMHAAHGRAIRQFAPVARARALDKGQPPHGPSVRRAAGLDGRAAGLHVEFGRPCFKSHSSENIRVAVRAEFRSRRRARLEKTAGDKAIPCLKLLFLCLTRKIYGLGGADRCAFVALVATGEINMYHRGSGWIPRKIRRAAHDGFFRASGLAESTKYALVGIDGQGFATQHGKPAFAVYGISGFQG